MTCPNCGHENSPEASFCGVCGTALAPTCPNCGREVQPDARFCAACGHSMTGDAATSERLAPASRVDPSQVIPRRDLGDLLGETFTLYRDNFWPLVLIAFVPQVPSILVAFVPGGSLVIDFAKIGVTFLVGIFLYILASGAFVYAVAQRYLGRSIDVRESYRRAWLKVLSLVIASIVAGIPILGAAIFSFILIGIPLLVWLIVIWFFIAQAIMIERQEPISALGRSKRLVDGSWWRVFGVLIIFFLIAFGISIVPSLIAGFISAFYPLIGSLLIAVIQTLVLPIGFIFSTLLYFDLRVRKEGYTLDRLASEMGG